MDSQIGNRLLTAKIVGSYLRHNKSGQVRFLNSSSSYTEASVSLDDRLLSKKHSPPLYRFANPCVGIMWSAWSAAIAPRCFAATSAADTA